MKTIFVSVGLFLLSLGALEGQVAQGGEFQVNSSTAVGQDYPSVAFDGAGHFVVVWQRTEPGEDTSIRGRRFRFDGGALGSEFRVNAPTGGRRFQPEVVMEPDGRFVVVWQDGSHVAGGDGRDGSGAGIFLRRFAADGTALSGEIRVNRTTAGHQFAPAAVRTGDGGFVVVWADGKHPDGDMTGIMAQRFTADGRRHGGELQVRSTTSGSLRDPSVGADGTGNFVVVWRQTYTGEVGYYGSSVTRIYGRRFAADATPRGGEFRVGSETDLYLNDYQYNAQVEVSEAGPFKVVWDVYTGEGGFFDVHGQTFSADGSPQIDEFQVNSEEWELVDQFEAASAMFPSGGLVVAWNSWAQDGTADEGSIVTRRFRADATAVGDELLVNSWTAGNQEHPEVAVTPDGDFVVVWSLADRTGTEVKASSIRAQRYVVPAMSSFTWSPAIPRPDETIQFTDTSDGKAPSAWAWSFGDGAVSSEQNPVHTYGQPGSYTVDLTVSDDFGSDSTSATVVVRGSCVGGPTALCLGGGRFLVEVVWRDFAGTVGPGRVVPASSADSGLFWFFNAENWEMLVKVLDGCHVNRRFWVFAAAATNVEYTLRVTDGFTGLTKSYKNPLGTTATAITDTGAFATCP